MLASTDPVQSISNLGKKHQRQYILYGINDLHWDDRDYPVRCNASKYQEESILIGQHAVRAKDKQCCMTCVLQGTIAVYITSSLRSCKVVPQDRW